MGICVKKDFNFFLKSLRDIYENKSWHWDQDKPKTTQIILR